MLCVHPLTLLYKTFCGNYALTGFASWEHFCVNTEAYESYSSYSTKKKNMKLKIDLLKKIWYLKQKGCDEIMHYIGCHLSASDGYLAMVETACEIGANTFAFFTRNPRGSKAKKEDPSDATAAMAALTHHGFGTLVAHGAYTMNLCTADPEARAFAASVLEDDLRRMALLPGQFYNFHPGSHVGQGTEAGIEQIALALKNALSHGYPVTVLLETMAGKGSEIGGNFQQLRMILDAVGSDNVGVCMDTCHVFDGGYDIVHNLDSVLREFDEIIGLHRLKALHLNDSKNAFGSRKDRHACLGEGSLGLDTFRNIMNHPMLAGKPMILETPNELPGYAREIQLLRNLTE